MKVLPQYGYALVRLRKTGEARISPDSFSWTRRFVRFKAVSAYPIYFLPLHLQPNAMVYAKRMSAVWRWLYRRQGYRVVRVVVKAA
jgi:hypothetical protein